MTHLTHAQQDALVWLRDRNSTGVFDRNGILLAGGELAPFAEITWSTLRLFDFVTFSQPVYSDRARRMVDRRVTLTRGGNCVARGLARRSAADDAGALLEATT
jgi:hypothetical protein